MCQLIPASIGARRLYIQDRYLIGTRLRLRRVEEFGLPTIYKLGQKIRFSESSISENAHTTIYLSEQEFGGWLAGLVLAEVDLGSTSSLPSIFPIDVNNEVTNDERFTGGELAMTTTSELASILNSFYID